MICQWKDQGDCEGRVTSTATVTTASGRKVVSFGPTALCRRHKAHFIEGLGEHDDERAQA